MNWDKMWHTCATVNSTEWLTWYASPSIPPFGFCRRLWYWVTSSRQAHCSPFIGSRMCPPASSSSCSGYDSDNRSTSAEYDFMNEIVCPKAFVNLPWFLICPWTDNEWPCTGICIIMSNTIEASKVLFIW